ncbi:MAG: (2Fe-2S)-binding protein [Candidatus Limnocylindria bacterium]
MTLHDVRFVLNGAMVEAAVPAERLLVDLLRDDLGLTGTKLGCGVGVCGACTILVDGVPMTGCLLLAAQIDGRSLRTIEGLADAELTPLQDAFVREGGSQCGICTPGQVLAATALLEASPSPSDDEVREAMKGNLCRCTGYYGIRRAIRMAAGR